MARKSPQLERHVTATKGGPDARSASRYMAEEHAIGTFTRARLLGFRGWTNRLAGLLFLEGHCNGGIGREPHLGAFDTGDEAELDIVVMTLVETVALALLELDAVAFDAIDGTDMHAIGADDLHVVLDVLRHGALPG
ncbi:hypothetical protein chiPu_0029028 [Chiloscyllium punctatum]|uniref:Uncharacterized protein n=1 Tax=Chiloscyllium punctatum TaxID=137246 RepID=A0A401TQ19_CHIPU|nr:hypothetical protein [Chiloscyllium punctatum]